MSMMKVSKATLLDTVFIFDAFLTDESDAGSILSIDLHTGYANRRLWNTAFTRAHPGYVGVYDGQLIYGGNGTKYPSL
jgi:hypothetical protein